MVGNSLGKRLNGCADVARAWLFQEAAPRWIDPAIMGSDMFPERILRSGAPDLCDHRLFVQARSIYSFLSIGALGWDGNWRDRSSKALEHILRNGRRADGFYIHKFALDGSVADSRADLYDQAFMIFMFAHAGKILDRPNLFEAAYELMETLSANWRHPAGGFREGEIATTPPRRQNPHMHLFEASLAMLQATENVYWRDLAEELAALAEACFIDPDSGALIEYFDNDLKPYAETGKVVEPGHCFEWAWLFEQLGGRGTDISDHLTSFARLHGLDHNRGITINEVYTDGSVRESRGRLWPQTERMKAAIARSRRLGGEEEVLAICEAFDGLQKYLDPNDRAIWYDKIKVDGSFEPENAPASSLYHIVNSYCELITFAESQARLQVL
ncbi:AGE family epimerase/isomerase [Martelella mediterranea]|uniref:AGE family epimerase/isomerase n=1 Tax=Martelella mediterranea TaxID=293089 RepID=UPI001E3300DE|nr:AGE family epimerase/isomerase [Martelella mediterranea]MCD1636958.1 AGE family epimerase/isomerase [Martelella mediterranea]